MPTNFDFKFYSSPTWYFHFKKILIGNCNYYLKNCYIYVDILNRSFKINLAFQNLMFLNKHF